MAHPAGSTPRLSGSSRSRQGHRSIFRVPNYRSVGLAQGSTRDPADRVFHSRRSHRKSRSGCLNCKQRKVKCDETKPHCTRCANYGVDCQYTGAGHADRSVDEAARAAPNTISLHSLGSRMGLVFVGSRLECILGSADGASAPPFRGGPFSTDRAVEALHHLHHVTGSSGAAGFSRVVMMKEVMELALETPFLMHAVIGFAITHLCKVSPDNSPYRLAEAYHWQQTIRQYSNEVSTKVSKQNMDKLFSTCLLLSVPSFQLEEFNPRGSFVFSDDPTALNWLRLQGGLRLLLERSASWLQNSMWWSTFLESHDPQVEFEDNRPGRVDLDADFADLCRITDASTVDNNPYLWPLRMLSNLLVLEISGSNASKYNTWMGRLEPVFFDCLAMKDPPALVLLAWWLALMCYADHWWMETRVRSECTAICMRLENSEDPLVLKLLEFPARTCGYLMRHIHKREEASLVSPSDLVVSI